MDAERVILIGGAAQNPAVQTVAAQVLGLPVVVPEPGEYVATGAAVQACWALDGQRPAGQRHTEQVSGVDTEPVIPHQYAATPAQPGTSPAQGEGG